MNETHLLKYVGCHVSIRGGYEQAARAAHRIGARSFQYFPKNPRSLSVKRFDPADALACAQFCMQHEQVSIAHAPYPTQLGLDGGDKRDAVCRSLLNDLEIAEACGSLGVVVHFGTYAVGQELRGYQNIVETLQTVLAQWDGKALLLLENQAGEGSAMGTTLEEMVHLRRLSGFANKIGFCFDTCHAFASGLWNGTDWHQLVRQGEQLEYFAHLKAVHLNDSLYGYGQRKDRHATVGAGAIGWQGMLDVLKTTEWLHALPVVLETPGNVDNGYREELLRIAEKLSSFIS